MITHVGLLIDTSGSMGNLRRPAVDAVNGILSSFDDVQRKMGQHYNVTPFYFGERLREAVLRNGRLAYDSYSPRDTCTRLRDGVSDAIDWLKAGTKAHADTYLLVTVTDGQENRSLTSYQAFRRKIVDHQASDRWTFAFNVPVGHTPYITALGIPAGNVNEWEQTVTGTRCVEEKTSGGILNYATARSLGRKSLTTFYANTDASRITPADLSQLDPCPPSFERRRVGKEDTIKIYTERITGRPYVIGQTYYQLMKPEVVQESKELLLYDKVSKNLYYGPRVRGFLGIQTGKRYKVNPGNHANFDVFVQSTSVNRILPRGTVAVIDTQRVIHMPPTWDHSKLAIL